MSMPDGATHIGRIGPNAILQLEEPVRSLIGRDAMAAVLNRSHVDMPSGDDMIPEDSVRTVHLALAELYPERAPEVRTLSGTATGAYIRAHRIPNAAKWALRLLPTLIGERILTRAIVCHAWTFCGSGSVSARHVSGRVEISIRDNPLVDRNARNPLQCDWHEAVFRDLYASLLRRDYRVSETQCCGGGAKACRFSIERM